MKTQKILIDISFLPKLIKTVESTEVQKRLENLYNIIETKSKNMIIDN